MTIGIVIESSARADHSEIPGLSALAAPGRHLALVGAVAIGLVVGLSTTALAVGTPRPAGPTGAEPVRALNADRDDTSAPTPTPAATLSAKVQAATMHDILPSTLPLAVDDAIVDDADALTDDELARVADAADDLDEHTSLRLYVVFLETFDGADPADWADQTATKSGLAPEDLLLAVATEDRVHGLSVDINGPLTDEQRERIAVASDDAVADGRWAQAAIDTARAARATQEADAPSWWMLWVAAGGVVLAALVVGGIVLVRRPRDGATRLFDESWQRAGGIDRRITRARKELHTLTEDSPADASRPVTGNVDQADRLVADARTVIDEGRAAGSRRERSFALACADAARQALDQADRLLDAVTDLRSDLADVGPRLDKATASLGQDVTDAERLAGDDPQVSMARTAARATLKQVELTRDTADPFTLLSRIAASEGALDHTLARWREPAEVDARATALLRDTLDRLDVRCRTIGTLIDTRDGCVGPEPRARLAEATELAETARTAHETRTDPPHALDLARQADQAAQQALTGALADIATGEVAAGMPLGGIRRPSTTSTTASERSTARPA